MQNSQNKKTLQIVLLVLVALLTISIGYASITAINLIINGNATASVNQNNFIVHFIEAKNITGTTGVGGTSIIDSDDTKASFNVTGLSKVGDYAEAKYVVKNDSNGIGAEITLELTNSNPEYFKVTETIADNKLQAGDTTLATVKVEMIKTPIDSDASTSVTAKLVASPIEDIQATGGEQKEIVKPKPYTYIYASKSYNWIRNETTIPNDLIYFDNYDDAINSYGNEYFIRYKTSDNIVESMQIGIKLNNNIFYLINNPSLSNDEIYEENKEILINLFGQANCTETSYNEGNEFSCRTNNMVVEIGFVGGACSGDLRSVRVGRRGYEAKDDCWICGGTLGRCF